MELPGLVTVGKDVPVALIDRFGCGKLVLPSWNAEFTSLAVM